MTCKLTSRGALMALSLVGSTMSASALSAQDTALQEDLKCFGAVSQLVMSDDAETKSMGMMGSVFFAGKIFGANPDIDLSAALLSVAQSLDPEEMPQLFERCGAELTRRGKQMEDAGDYIMKKVD
ncbi:hypothetical protein [Qipengyuania sp.]|uniref:hypothetical protein n=1 Tax=Qipengyuania sp. TaxID=2004515 RepID=UPI0035C86439